MFPAFNDRFFPFNLDAFISPKSRFPREGEERLDRRAPPRGEGRGQRGQGSCGGLPRSDEVLPSLRPDLEKRKNPVCHFVTPLDGSVDVDEHRRPEVFGMWSRRLGKGLALTEGATNPRLGARVGFPSGRPQGRACQLS